LCPVSFLFNRNDLVPKSFSELKEFKLISFDFDKLRLRLEI